MSKKDKQVILCILDGWGLAENNESNAIAKASTPCWDFLLKKYPHSLLNASGEDVGLPPQQMGNSEVGHLTIGAGRTINQSLQSINIAIKNKTYEQNSEFTKILTKAKQSGGVCHLFGMLSNGGIHGHIDHLIYFAKFISKLNIKVNLHLFLDGRDAPQNAAYTFLTMLKEQIKSYTNILIASISGRFYAMDRDNNWERTYTYFEAIYSKQCTHVVDDFNQYITQNYQQNIFDEFISPAINISYSGIQNNDCIIFTNFRADRMIQLCSIFVDHEAHSHLLNPNITLSGKVAMTLYFKQLSTNFLVLENKQNVDNGLGEVISKNGFAQKRIAETEKFAHVTYFFNGGKETPYPLEERCLVPSIKTKSFIDHPEMRTREVASEIIEAINSNKYKFILANFSAPDMLGHTGNMPATIAAIEHIDKELNNILEAALKANITIIITADHGNCENMILSNGQVCTSHTNNPVPFILIDNELSRQNINLKNGSLKDIAPTILTILKLTIPNEMQGESLIKL